MGLYNDDEKNYFDNKYYVINLKYTKSEVDKALSEFTENKKVTPIIRAILHEHAHYIQSATTSVGYYLKMLDDYQNSHIRDMVNEMIKTNKICYPMINNIVAPEHIRKENKNMTTHYYYWVLAEIVRQMLLGNEETVSYYLDRMMEGAGYFDYYLELDECLKCCYLYIEKQGTEKESIANQDEFLNNIFKVATLLQRFLGFQISDVLESQALLAEYFYDEVADERLIKYISIKKMDREQKKYCLPLILYYECYEFDLKNKSDFLSFKLGFHAICQIVLSAPILPFQKRSKHTLLLEIEINTRFLILWNICSKINPPKSKEDYSRYIKELTELMETMPIEYTYKECLENKRYFYNNFIVSVIEDRKEEIFFEAQEKYLNDISSFYQTFELPMMLENVVGIKYNNQQFEGLKEELGYIVIDLMYQYYIELLYGYQIKKKNNKSKEIFVYPHMKLSNKDMELLQWSITIFNEGMQRRNKNLPQCVLKESKYNHSVD